MCGFENLDPGRQPDAAVVVPPSDLVVHRIGHGGEGRAEVGADDRDPAAGSCGGRGDLGPDQARADDQHPAARGEFGTQTNGVLETPQDVGRRRAMPARQSARPQSGCEQSGLERESSRCGEDFVRPDADCGSCGVQFDPEIGEVGAEGGLDRLSRQQVLRQWRTIVGVGRLLSDHREPTVEAA
ncbi:hypothetical protein EBN03_11870 [Nocardia stercoris]|uniref:Uncharacterized protein n=1 Tax=Nocardia stercoris TaxID=2483361 RepID=A0A3M2L506_9NOCA|nr:hypothetical protein EBN03_11870 [Nocardia stercoris]